MKESKVSEFKLKLQTLITEVRELREKEAVSSDQLHSQFQKWKQSEEESCRKITELAAELASSVQLTQQLQRKVQFLEDENYLLQSKHKELKETINCILQAKEAFLNAYQESTCEMKRSIESRDRKIATLSEKINAHLLSLESVRKEASLVKQVVDNAQHAVDEKEEVVARLKIQMDKVCELEGLLIEKNNDLEAKLKSNENELYRKDRVIAELQTQLETAKITNQRRSKIEELQEAMLMKEGIIETLILENKALRSELGMLEVSFKVVQETMTHMDEEDRVAYSLILANEENDATEKDGEDDRINHDIKNCEANSHHGAPRAPVAEIADSPCKEHAHIAIPLRENNVHSCVSESTFSPSSSVHSESQPTAANASNVPGAENKDKCNTCIQQLDSECSTTRTGTS
ncbi:peroxisomal and mitochondrial division factor 1 [Helianthus annuus]|uniref:peroxisomal and mitochondrial division factor 1 n=1 Tax=Helianthus annuus TaxID=4232 RepID=UPI000B907357|nr:peroxisomal and mitochondrial division factor 1 [Helianthus annuus]